MVVDYLDIDVNLALYYLVDFFIALVLLSGMRYLSGIVSNVSATQELSQKDNNAFGISLAGAMIAVSIMLMGVVSGESAYNLGAEAIQVVVFGLLGIVLMWVTRIVFDHVSFPGLSIHQQIMQGNVSASIIDACNMIATAIIIKGAMVWVNGDLTTALVTVVVSFVASQIVMALATFYRVSVYKRRHKGQTLHKAIEENNQALAIRFSAYRIGIAIAVSAAFKVVEYDPEEFIILFLIWFSVALILFFLLTLIAMVIRLGVLHKVNIREEVGEQANLAVGVIEGAIYIVVGLLLAGLISA